MQEKLSDLINQFESLTRRASILLQKLEDTIEVSACIPDLQAFDAFRWQSNNNLFGRFSRLEPIVGVSSVRLSDLHKIENQKKRISTNTLQFLLGLPANHVLLTGARGTGKSSLVQACLNEYKEKGLRLIEIDRNALLDLPVLFGVLASRPEKFIVFCDDLSFDTTETDYKNLKSVLDGSLSVFPDNVLVYATSNRRHLMPEFFSENLQVHYRKDGEIDPSESIEEKVSLSDRFGLWIPFYSFTQDDYLTIVAHWLRAFGIEESRIESLFPDALRFALERGVRSGRIANQFARHVCGADALLRRASEKHSV